MSRLGKIPVEIPDKVKVTLSGRTVNVEGPQGKVSWTHRPEIEVKVDGKRVVVSRKSDEKRHKQLHGTTRALIATMITGASAGFAKELEINGVGYNAKLAGTKLTLTLGYSHPVEFEVPKGLKVEVPSPTSIRVSGADKCLVGEFSARIRRSRKAEPYNLKGIKYKDEVVRRKAGKTFVTGAS